MPQADLHLMEDRAAAAPGASNARLTASRVRFAAFLAAAPWALSFLAHAGVIVAAAGAFARRPSIPSAPSVSISFGESRTPPRPPDAAPAPHADPAAPPPILQPARPLPAPDFTPLPLPESAAIALDDSALPALAPTELDSLAVAPSDLSAAPPPELFGARGERAATRVVYVIDASGSMVAALPTVVRELQRSINQLAPECHFQALVFKAGGFATAPGVDRDSLVRATDANKRGLSRWLASIRADRRGDPLPALERAITYRPDVIFLVSKGLADASLSPEAALARKDDLLARLNALNPASRTGRRPVSIKVIQFFEPDATGLMRQIGSTHGGDDGYTFLSRKDLNLE